MLGNGLKCGNPGFGASNIAITAAGYYYTSINSFRVVNNEIKRIQTTRCKTEHTIEMAHITPAIVNMAFACELAIKSLLSEADRRKEHNLRKLYDLLEPQYQKELRERAIWGAKLEGDEDFYDKLNACSNNFVEWRYFYESGNRSIRFHYLVLQSMVEEVLDMYGIDYPI